MSTIVVKNFPDALHGRLKERAERNHRSMTKEVVHLLAVGLGAEQAVVTRALPMSDMLTSDRRDNTHESGTALALIAPEASPPLDGREALRAALLKQADGSYINVLGIEDDNFFHALERIRAQTKMPELSHLFDDKP